MTPSSASASVLRYDRANDRWLGIAQLPHPTYLAAGAAVGSAIYLLGGGYLNTYCGSGGRYAFNSDEILRFDPATGATTLVARLPFPTDQAQAMVVGSTIYVAGGYDQCSNEWVNRKVVAFDTTTATVRLVAAQAPCWVTATVQVAGTHYAFCDLGMMPTGASNVLRFDPGSERFVETGLSFAWSTQQVATASHDGFGYVFGGAHPGPPGSDRIWKFDPARGTFTELATRLPTPLFAMAFGTTSTGTYLVGGRTGYYCNAESSCSSDRTMRFLPGVGAPEPSPAPARPTNLRPGSADSAHPELVPTPQPTFAWDPVVGATSYRVSIRTSPGNSLVFDGDVGLTTTWPVPQGKLSAGAPYLWTVTAINAGGSSPPSTPAYIKVDAAKPSPYLRLLPDATRWVTTEASCGSLARLDANGKVTVPVHHVGTETRVYLCASDGATVQEQTLTSSSKFVFTYNTNIDVPAAPLSVAYARYTPGLVASATARLGGASFTCATDQNHAGHDSGCNFTAAIFAAVSPLVVSSFDLQFDLSQPIPRFAAPSSPCATPSDVTYQSYVHPAADRFMVPTPVVMGLLKSESSLLQYRTKDCYTLVARDGGLGVSQITGGTFSTLASTTSFVSYLSSLGESGCTPPAWTPEALAGCISGSARANAAAGTYWLSVKRDLFQPYPCTRMTGEDGVMNVPGKQVVANWVGPVAWYKGRALNDPHVRAAFELAGMGPDWTKRMYVDGFSSDTWRVGVSSEGSCTLASLTGPAS